MGRRLGLFARVFRGTTCTLSPRVVHPPARNWVAERPGIKPCTKLHFGFHPFSWGGWTYDAAWWRVQVFNDNMSIINKPVIKACKPTDNWTQISFTPDLARFNMTELEEDICSLMRKRVYDAAGVLGKGVKVPSRSHPSRRLHVGPKGYGLPSNGDTPLGDQ